MFGMLVVTHIFQKSYSRQPHDSEHPVNFILGSIAGIAAATIDSGTVWRKEREVMEQAEVKLMSAITIRNQARLTVAFVVIVGFYPPESTLCHGTMKDHYDSDSLVYSF